MRGSIILPTYLSEYCSPKIKNGIEDFSDTASVIGPIFYAIRDEFKFELKYEDKIDVPFTTDMVVTFGIPYHNRPHLIPGILDLSKHTKLVMFPGDLQCYNNSECLVNKIKVFERCDLLISGAYEQFENLYPQFWHKYVFSPLFFGPHDRYTSISFNNNPIMRCLLSGSMNPEVYPLRVAIKNAHMNEIDYKPTLYVRGDRYAKMLNSYFCCATCGSIFNSPIAKYFEIPAAGSLLIANETNDLIKVGFIPNVHYVPITKHNFTTVISQCLKNPSAYETIRKTGMGFVREKHGLPNRIEQLKRIFDTLF
uniref:Putative glycosyltransferase n=1 Tax=viral metagenome TaxID=1070528 RepID=A0A6M3K9H7_9ZZZZ